MVKKKVIKVKINGVEYDTYIDRRGVQRFKANGVLDYLTSSLNKAGNLLLDLNQVAVAYAHKKFTKREYIEFNMMLGYSVCGLCDLSFMKGVKVDNPLWKDNA